MGRMQCLIFEKDNETTLVSSGICIRAFFEESERRIFGNIAAGILKIRDTRGGYARKLIKTVLTCADLVTLHCQPAGTLFAVSLVHRIDYFSP